MVQGDHNVGKVIDIPPGRFTGRNMHPGLVNIHWYDPVSSMDILPATSCTATHKYCSLL